MKKFIIFAACFLVSFAAQAQVIVNLGTQHGSSFQLPGVAIYCASDMTQGSSLALCNFGGSGGGTVNQGAAGTQPWPVVDSNVEAAIGINAAGSQPGSALQLGGWDGSSYQALTLNGDDSLYVAIDNSSGGAGASNQPLYIATSSSINVQESTSPTGGNCTRTTIATGGTASTLIASAAMNGAIIQNPLSATDQGISTAEILHLSQQGTASCSVGNGNTITLQPGGSYTVPRGTFTISACAATTNHAVFCTKY